MPSVREVKAIETLCILSIIIPVYNAGKYISACLDSVIAGITPGTELLLIDDGSTDDSLQICHDYASRYNYIKVFSQVNQGPSHARNFGIAQAQGEFLTFIDSDDYVISGKLRDVVSRLDEYKDVELWASDFHRVADNGCVLDKVYQIADTESPFVDAGFLSQYLSAGDCVWNVWRYIYRRSFLLRENLRFAEGVSCGEDLEFMCRVLMRAKSIAYFHNPYYCYRVNYGDTLTRCYTAQRVRQLMQALTAAADYLNAVKTPEAQLLTNMVVREYLLTSSLYAELDREQQAEAAGYIARAGYITGLSSKPTQRFAGKALDMFGISAFSHALLEMKKLKRLIRQIKIKDYAGKAADRRKNEC